MSRSNILSLTFALLISLICQSSLSLKPTGYELLDLNTNGTDFDAQASQWTNTGLYDSPTDVFVCADTPLVGGYNVLDSYDGSYFQRIYTDLPQHNMIYFSFNFWMIDSWDFTDSFDIVFDSVRVEGWRFAVSDFPIDQFFCGTDYFQDLPNVTIVGRTPHNSDSLTLQIVSHTNNGVWDESFGFRDVNLLFLNRTEVETAEACAKASISLFAMECPCEAEIYLDFSSTTTCSNCSANCASCFGPNPEDCFMCVDGYSYINQQCTGCYSGCLACHGTGSEECDTCEADKFLSWNNSCIDTCDYPLTTVTLSNGYQECVYPCESSEYLYWNGSCLTDCEGVFIPREEFGVLFCDFTCSGGGYLYWDTFCSSVCPHPLTSIETSTASKFCSFGCPENTDFLYWDSSCSDSCLSPLVANTYHSRQFCTYPCESTDDFIYPNNTCQSTCPSPYKTRIEGVVRHCDLPCPEEEFLYWNGTCIDSCKAPLSIRVTVDVISCDYLCASQEYLFWDGSCVTSCEFPLIIQDENGYLFCNLPCSSPYEYYYDGNGECDTQCLAPNVINNHTLYLSCSQFVASIVIDDSDLTDDDTNNTSGLSKSETYTGAVINTAILVDTVMAVPTEPTTVVIILYVKLIQYIRYLDISYPKELQNVLNSKWNWLFVLNFGPSIPSEIKTAFQDSSIPIVFKKYLFHSSFLVNFWKAMITLAIVLGVVCAIRVIEKLIDHLNLKRGRVLTDQIKVILRWNFVLIIFISNIDEIILYSSLEFHTLNIDSIQSVISLLICIIMLASILVPIIGSYFPQKTIKNQKAKALAEGSQLIYTHYVRKWQGFQVLWSGFRDDTVLKQLFLVIYISRTIFAYLIASLLYSSPLLQTILYIVISIALLIYIVLQKPLRNKINQIQLYAYETVILLVNLSVLILAILDKSGAQAEQLRLFLGDVVICCHVALNIISIGFLAIKIGARLKKIYKLYKKSRRFGKKGCFQLFLLPLQQITMGFEKITFPSKGIDLKVTRIQNDLQESKLERPTSRPKSRFSLSSQGNSNSTASLNKTLETQSTLQLPSSRESSARARLKAVTVLIKQRSVESQAQKLSKSESNLGDGVNSERTQLPQESSDSFSLDFPPKVNRICLPSYSPSKSPTKTSDDKSSTSSPSKTTLQSLGSHNDIITPLSIFRRKILKNYSLVLSPKDNSGLAQEVLDTEITKQISPRRSRPIRRNIQKIPEANKDMEVSFNDKFAGLGILKQKSNINK